MPRFAFLSKFARWVLQRELADLRAALLRSQAHADMAEDLAAERQIRLVRALKDVAKLQDANHTLVAEIESLHRAEILRAEFDQRFGGTD